MCGVFFLHPAEKKSKLRVLEGSLLLPLLQSEVLADL